LTDDTGWQGLSAAARQNAERFHWDACSRPLLRMFDVVSCRETDCQALARHKA
jgi:hypothetical protein